LVTVRGIEAERAEPARVKNVKAAAKKRMVKKGEMNY
jgi:hypothetical protein